MAKNSKPKSFIVRARQWASRRGLFGSQAFLRYVMLSYLDGLSLVLNDFVFKGGNLLWLYIQTPRSTVDLDLSTLYKTSHDEVRSILEEACQKGVGIAYKIENFEPISSGQNEAAAVRIRYETDQGASNVFDVDIVYGLRADFIEIASPVNEDRTLKAASLENIIADKLQAAHRFGLGNTRMKDFDDLWRLSQSGVEVRSGKLNELLKDRKVTPDLDETWIADDIERAWDTHSSRYKDLPKDLRKIFRMVNEWLRKS